MAQGNPFNMNANTGGLKPPDFSIHNQFATAAIPQSLTGNIAGASSSPFSMSSGAAAASSNLPNFSSGQFGAGGNPQLGGGMSNGAIGQAAQKLMQAADKLIQAADRLMGGAGGMGGGRGGPSFGQGMGGSGRITGTLGFDSTAAARTGAQSFYGGSLNTGNGELSLGLIQAAGGGGAAFRHQGSFGPHTTFQNLNNLQQQAFQANQQLNAAQQNAGQFAGIPTHLQTQAQIQQAQQANQQLGQAQTQAQQAQQAYGAAQNANPFIAGIQRRAGAITTLAGGLAGTTSLVSSLEAQQSQLRASGQYAYEQMGGLGNTFREIRAQQAGLQRGSIAGAATGIIGGIGGFIMGGPGGAVMGYTIGQQMGNQLGSTLGTDAARKSQLGLYEDKLIQYQSFRENMNLAISAADVFSAAGQNTGIKTAGDRILRDTYFKQAASVTEYNRLGSTAAEYNRSSLLLSGLRGGGLSTRLGMGGEFGNFRSALGLSGREAMGELASAISASGRTGAMDEDLLIGAMQGGFSSGQVGFAASGRNAQTGVRGLGLGARGVLERANNYGLRGDAANQYIAAELGFFGSYAQQGVNISKGFVERSNRFINAGRNMGLRSFDAGLAYQRTAEVGNMGNRAAMGISQMFAGVGEDLLLMQSLMDNNGDLTAAYGDLKSLSGERAQSMLRRVSGGSADIMNFAMMGMNMSPDVMNVMTKGNIAGANATLSRKAIQADLTAAGGSAAETIADRESNLMKAFDEASFKQISKLDEQIAEAKLTNKQLGQIVKIFASAKNAVPEPVKAYAPAGKKSSGSPSAAPATPTPLQNYRQSGGRQSDIRLKNSIKKIGVSKLGINIYEFKYIWDATKTYVGVMAQELLGTKFNDAAILGDNGYYSVDYSMLDVEFKEI